MTAIRGTTAARPGSGSSDRPRSGAASPSRGRSTSRRDAGRRHAGDAGSPACGRSPCLEVRRRLRGRPPRARRARCRGPRSRGCGRCCRRGGRPICGRGRRAAAEVDRPPTDRRCCPQVPPGLCPAREEQRGIRWLRTGAAPGAREPRRRGRPVPRGIPSGLAGVVMRRLPGVRAPWPRSGGSSGTAAATDAGSGVGGDAAAPPRLTIEGPTPPRAFADSRRAQSWKVGQTGNALERQ